MQCIFKMDFPLYCLLEMGCLHNYEAGGQPAG